MQRHLFLDPNWPVPLRSQAPDNPLKRWLDYPLSLTLRLSRSFGPIEVQVLEDKLASPLADERKWLPHLKQPCRIREVLLCHQGQPLVFAHSLIPQTTELHRHRSLAKLGNQPLGQWLFQQPHIERQSISYKKLRPSHPLFRRIPNAKEPHYWARRSWFKLGKEGLLVSEVFLVSMP